MINKNLPFPVLLVQSCDIHKIWPVSKSMNEKKVKLNKSDD